MPDTDNTDETDNTDKSGASGSALATDWISEDDVSARSLLVTVFGDSILPVTTSVWLSQLFELTQPFGFSQRLIRTSLFRLGADNWVSSERVGRQSRYSLTPLAVRESADADRRIYLSEDLDWDGSWTVVLLDTPMVSGPERDEIAKHLRWHGFISFGRGVMASPVTGPKAVLDLLTDLDLADPPLMIEGEIHDMERLVGAGLFTEAFAMVEVEAGYADFLARYRSFRERRTASLDPLGAYVMRTMLIHDLRRIRLREPDVPTSLLPSGWIGRDAYELAAELYAKLSPGAGEALATILQMTYPASIAGRFPD